jgi:hypothetical protein
MRGELRIELRTRAGEVLEAREVLNSVLRSGAELVAKLFSGTGSAITHMAVGTSDASEGDAFLTASLMNPAEGSSERLTGGTEAAIPAEAFSIEIDETKRVARVRVRATLPPSAAIGTVREAGLLSREGDAAVLYNRVTFASITKGNDHELTMFWVVSFPYGDLQWLM